MAIRRDREAREGKFHWHDTWKIARKEDEDGEAVFFWSGPLGWVPWDSDAKAFEIRKEAEDLMAGFVLTDPDPEWRNYRLEMNSERYDDHVLEDNDCKWCLEGPRRVPRRLRDLGVTETLKDGQKRKPYDEGSVPDRKPE